MKKSIIFILSSVLMLTGCGIFPSTPTPAPDSGPGGPAFTAPGLSSPSPLPSQTPAASPLSSSEPTATAKARVASTPAIATPSPVPATQKPPEQAVATVAPDATPTPIPPVERKLEPGTVSQSYAANQPVPSDCPCKGFSITKP